MKFGGMVVCLDNKLVRSLGWRFPKEKFFEWEPEDERLCRFLGIGHEEFEYLAYQVKDTLYLHPKVWQELKKQVPEACMEEPLSFFALRDLGPIIRPNSAIMLTTA